MSILDEIVAQKREEADRLPPYEPPRSPLPPRRGLASRLQRCGPVAVIAEIKRRSPSRPVLRADFSPAAMARAYQAGGAAALSVLTDERYFGGSLDHLREARAACDLPVLRKDFLVDVRQVREARLAGADAILLIAACLDDADLVLLRDAARAWDLEILVEVHDEHELDRVLAVGGFPLIGINNRNLRTFEVDLATTECLCRKMAGMAGAPGPGALGPDGGNAGSGDQADHPVGSGGTGQAGGAGSARDPGHGSGSAALEPSQEEAPHAGTAPQRPAGRDAGDQPLVVSESGIRTSEDLARVAAWGCRAVLVGESLLVQPDLERAVRALLGRAADRDTSEDRAGEGPNVVERGIMASVERANPGEMQA